MNLSFIVPIYNGSRFIDGLGQNILDFHQAVEGVEFIFVNDGSTDDSSEKLRQFLAEHDQSGLTYKIIDTANGGVSRARNTALAVATGDYAMFMDHDDNIDAAKFAGLWRQFVQSGADLMHFGCNEKYPAGDKVFTRDEFITDFPFMSYVWAYVYRRSLMEEPKLRFTEGMKYLEDGVFLLDYILRTQQVFVSNQKIYDYVDNPDSAMRAGRNPEQNRQFLDDIGLAVRSYNRLAATPAPAAVQKRLREIRDSFVFIYIVNMLKTRTDRKTLFARLNEAGYDFKLADYPSKFNQRRQVKVLCALFRSRCALSLLAKTGLLNRVA
ncbi:glycosyltransferase [Neisseria perflava]|uniref:glycosyltransferase n=1 Tax=Neisseria perflava TaxID=33053 RepID=UPI00209D32FF|nr:glycosyltransferase [Neisseria perflava]MCP1660351.1 glycosyltransferase involved in cell wall biosynthesis [Neisseria perflava]